MADPTAPLPASPTPSQAGRGESAPPFVGFRDVFLAYEGHTDFAVENISLSIQPGEFVAIVGPSGCGKSTFMKLATGLKPPTKGTVTVEGNRDRLQPERRPAPSRCRAEQVPEQVPADCQVQ